MFYYLTEDRREVDFVSQDGMGAWHLWQVCWDMSSKETVLRETSALETAEKELKMSGQLITPQLLHFHLILCL